MESTEADWYPADPAGVADMETLGGAQLLDAIKNVPQVPAEVPSAEQQRIVLVDTQAGN